MNALTPVTASTNADAYRASTDAAGMCRDIVVATASTIQGRKFVSVEGWQAIAIAHGCTAGARDVEKVDGGVRAIGEVRRMSDGGVISTAEGFVGEDEPTWYGGNSRGKQLPKRADYAIRAMAQTRAISRACRSAFAHVVVMMNAGLQTTPAEEVPEGGFDNGNVIEHPPTTKPDVAYITDGQRDILMTLANAKGIDARTFCKVANVKTVKELPANEFDKAKGWIDKQKPRAARSQDQAATVLLDDEIPY